MHNHESDKKIYGSLFSFCVFLCERSVFSFVVGTHSVGMKCKNINGGKIKIFIIKAGSFLHGLTRELVKLGSILLLGFADPIQSEDY